jgi:hypothetical protein
LNHGGKGKREVAKLGKEERIEGMNAAGNKVVEGKGQAAG